MPNLFNRIILLLFTSITFLSSQTFIQNFNSSTTLTDYYNATPSANQFDNISAGTGVTVSVASNNLSFTRSSSSTGSGYFARSTNFSPAPTGIIIKFDISVSGNITEQISAAKFYIGSNFTSTSGTPANSDCFARFSINLTSTDGTFHLKDISNTGSNTSSNLSNTQTIRWVLNNTGSTLNYTDPNGSTESIANDKADIWANTTKIFNDVVVETITQSITDFKFIYTDGAATITIDNIEVGFSNDNISLPVELKNFTARTLNNNVILNWKTATETNNSGFEVERSTRHALQTSLNRNWEKVGFVRGSGTSSVEKEYTFTDNNLRNGKYSYRLKQIDLDGTTEYSQIKEIEVGGKNRRLRTNPNPFNSTTVINFEVEEKTEITIKLYDLLGRVVAEILNNELKEVGVHEVKFNANHLTSGVYLLKFQTNKNYQVEKLVLIK